MSGSPAVSIVVPTFNHAQFLHQALPSQIQSRVQFLKQRLTQTLLLHQMLLLKLQVQVIPFRIQSHQVKRLLKQYLRVILFRTQNLPVRRFPLPLQEL